MPYSDPNIKAEIIQDSLGRFDDRLTTFVLTMPRIILAEFNTHRMISRSTASSRAIPVQKQIQKVKDNPFVPSWWGEKQSGMQAANELVGDDKRRAMESWFFSASECALHAAELDKLKVHKQIANRVIEPFTYCTTIATATDWHNFFHLRANPMTQPEFMVLAFRMLEVYLSSTPVHRDVHIPFSDNMQPGLFEDERIKVAVARCARVSYLNHDGKSSAKEDIAFHDRLLKDKHMSPFEHIAHVSPMGGYVGNFRGWIQYRKKIQGENILKCDLKKLYKSKPSWIL